MLTRHPCLCRRRRGVTTIEVALVSPILLALMLGLMIGALGVFRYQQVASLAREGARWASVHGGQYQKETGNPEATPLSIYQNAIAPHMVDLDVNALSYSVTWSADENPYHTVIDANGNLVKVTNTVTVTVSYQWVPEGYFPGATFTSTSTLPMSY
jgi:Flp pilus assembly protein TadG